MLTMFMLCPPGRRTPKVSPRCQGGTRRLHHLTAGSVTTRGLLLAFPLFLMQDSERGGGPTLSPMLTRFILGPPGLRTLKVSSRCQGGTSRFHLQTAGSGPTREPPLAFPPPLQGPGRLPRAHTPICLFPIILEGVVLRWRGAWGAEP